MSTNAPGAIVLYPVTIPNPFTNLASVQVQISPAPSIMPSTTFSSSDSTTIVVDPTQPPGPPGSSTYPTPPPNGALLLQGTARGKTTITVTVGPPYNTSFQASALSLNSAFVACDLRAAPALSLDSSITQVTPANADLFATEPAPSNPNPNDLCASGGYTTPSGSQSLLNYPSGGVVIPGTLATFPGLTTGQWSNAGTSTPAGTQGVLLFRGRNGAIAKVLLTQSGGGPIEIAQPNASFPF